MNLNLDKQVKKFLAFTGSIPNNTGVTVFKQQSSPLIGDMVTFHTESNSTDITIVGTLTSSPFNNTPDIGTIICSENTFRQITGQAGYTIIDLQLTKNATETDVNRIHKSIGKELLFFDERFSSNEAVWYIPCHWFK